MTTTDPAPQIPTSNSLLEESLHPTDRGDNWLVLRGKQVEILRGGTRVALGTVEEVSSDGQIVWIRSPVEGRKLYERAESYEARPV